MLDDGALQWLRVITDNKRNPTFTAERSRRSITSVNTSGSHGNTRGWGDRRYFHGGIRPCPCEELVGIMYPENEQTQNLCSSSVLEIIHLENYFFYNIYAVLNKELQIFCQTVAWDIGTECYLWPSALFLAVLFSRESEKTPRRRCERGEGCIRARNTSKKNQQMEAESNKRRSGEWDGKGVGSGRRSSTEEYGFSEQDFNLRYSSRCHPSRQSPRHGQCAIP